MNWQCAKRSTRKCRRARPISRKWLEPVASVVAAMGSSCKEQTGIEHIEFLNVLAFVGSFSGRYSIDLFNRISGDKRLGETESKEISSYESRILPMQIAPWEKLYQAIPADSVVLTSQYYLEPYPAY